MWLFGYHHHLPATQGPSAADASKHQALAVSASTLHKDSRTVRMPSSPWDVVQMGCPLEICWEYDGNMNMIGKNIYMCIYNIYIYIVCVYKCIYIYTYTVPYILYLDVRESFQVPGTSWSFLTEKRSCSFPWNTSCSLPTSGASALRISRRRLSPAAWGKMKVTWQASLGPWVMSCDVKMGDVKQEEKQE